MTDVKIKVVKNTVNAPCNNCGGIHDYITRLPQVGDVRKDCSLPVAFSIDKATRMARLLGMGDEAVIDAPHDSIVVMDDSARKLPHGEPVMLAQLVERELLA